MRKIASLALWEMQLFSFSTCIDKLYFFLKSYSLLFFLCLIFFVFFYLCFVPICSFVIALTFYAVLETISVFTHNKTLLSLHTTKTARSLDRIYFFFTLNLSYARTLYFFSLSRCLFFFLFKKSSEIT